MSDSLAEKANSLPTAAGVYLFRDSRGRAIYVGKAVNLRARVRQYLAGQDERFMVPHLVRNAADVEFIVTHTEKEALLLENTLIKKHRPRYNTKLRDDKNFLHLRIDPRSAWPRFMLVRRIRDDGARYFGPFASASRARQTLALLERTFPLRTCSDTVLKSRKRPCILHQMHRCSAPCVSAIARCDYDEIIEESILFLEGRYRPLQSRMVERMRRASEAENFEEAARLRDLVRSVEATLERQQVVDPKLGNRDIWGVFREGTRGVATVIPVREGAMGEPRTSGVGPMLGEDADLISSLLNEGYPSGSDIPREILVPCLPDDAPALEEVLSERRSKKVEIAVPQRGDKARLLALAIENARLKFHHDVSESDRNERALEELARVLSLSTLPRRIECFDNSNLQGAQPVAAMSVFLDGEPARAEYRRYRVKSVIGADDFATMREILGRRLRRGLQENALPDLLVVDGGHGQLNAALAIAREVGVVEVPLIGISKPRTELARGEKDATDKIVLPNVKDPIRLREGHPALRLLQHLRDEAHRHAIRYHRKRRGAEALASLLEGIPGVGPSRRRALLTHLGSLDAVAGADVATLAAIPGIGSALAESIHESLSVGRQ